MLVEVQLIAQVLRESIEDLRRAKREPDVQELLAFRLRSRARVEVRKIMRRDDLPDVEVDILLSDRVAIEIKLNSHYREGLDQVLILRDLYDLSPVLVHITDGFSRREVEALRRISEREGFPTIVADLRSEEVICLG